MRTRSRVRNLSGRGWPRRCAEGVSTHLASPLIRPAGTFSRREKEVGVTLAFMNADTPPPSPAGRRCPQGG